MLCEICEKQDCESKACVTIKFCQKNNLSYIDLKISSETIKLDEENHEE